MAATWGRLTGRAGVCLSTLGPGATNLVTAAAYAQLGGMPMLMITGRSRSETSKQGHFQIVDVVDMMRPLTKYTRTIVVGRRHPGARPGGVPARAAGGSGAVHLELPEDVARESTEAEPIPPSYDRRPVADESPSRAPSTPSSGAPAAAHDRRRRQPQAHVSHAPGLRRAHRAPVLQHPDGQGGTRRDAPAVARHGGAVRRGLRSQRHRRIRLHRQRRSRRHREAAVRDAWPPADGHPPELSSAEVTRVLPADRGHGRHRERDLADRRVR